MNLKAKQLLWLLYAKFFFLYLAVFAPFTHPHIIRQMDSMGIAIRYWLRWTIEPAIQYPLLPALIQAGDAYGIHATEFPILYLIFAPIFSLPAPWSIFLAKFLFLSLSLGLTYISYRVWAKDQIEKVDFKIIHIFLVIYGITGAYIGKFMPDYIASILVFLAMGISYRRVRVLSFILASIGLLIKPTAVICFGFYLLKPRKELMWQIVKWIAPATLIAIIYYVWGTTALNELSDIPRYFYSKFRNPAVQLVNFFKAYDKILSLIFKDIFSSFLLILLLWDIFKNGWVQKKLWGILLLQILAGAALDGDHSFIHDYYYMGAAFTVAILMGDYWLRSGKKMSYFLLFVLFASILDKGIYANKETFSLDNKWWQCAEIQKQLEGEYKIRTNISRPADLGTCVGKIQNSKNARYGVFLITEKLNEGVVVMQTKDYKLVKFD
jgi:hypothetical protein